MNRPTSNDPAARWRQFADWAKRRRWALTIADRLGRGRGRVRFLDALHEPVRPRRLDLRPLLDAQLGVAMIGHATTLLRVGGRTILTDPVFSNRIGISAGWMTLGPRRRLAPAISIDRLPPLDLILLTHAHFDHLDRPTLARLPRTGPVIAASDNRDLIDDLGFSQVIELKWGRSLSIGDLAIHAVPCQHWSPRVFMDDHRGYNAYLIKSARHRVLFGGDTALHDGFADHAPIDLMLVGIGAYDPFIYAHANPEQAYEMARQARARHVAPMHH
ncbi:MAG TPA: MBL fold metallo-hydrolase, partial [Tepidisphaeraceae bacterium]|nr:MBL fold metallo-hydrolase [Tepidisphaeraceae bacterium]